MTIVVELTFLAPSRTRRLVLGVLGRVLPFTVTVIRYCTAFQSLSALTDNCALLPALTPRWALWLVHRHARQTIPLACSSRTFTSRCNLSTTSTSIHLYGFCNCWRLNSTSHLQVKTAIMSLCINRLQEERKQWRKDHPFGFFAKPGRGANGLTDLKQWDVGIPGKANTIWNGGLFKLTMTFPDEYPTKPPKCKDANIAVK